MGVRVASKDQVYLMGSQWRILISMEHPTINFEGPIETVKNQVKNAWRLDDQEKQAYLSKLAELQVPYWQLRWRNLNMPSPVNRAKRGLLDFIGDISSYAFGLVTHKQLDEVKQYVSKCMKSQQQLFVDLKNYVAVVNDSVAAINVNEHNIQLLKHSVESQFDCLTVRAFLSDAIVDLLMATMKRDKVLDYYLLAKSRLEQATLTEEVLPAEYMAKIVGSSTLNIPLVWYYQTVRIKPQYYDEKRLVFLIEVVIPEPPSYLEYVLEAVPVSLGNVTAKLRLEPVLAMSTATGKMFRPDENSCRGNYPRVCAPRPVTQQSYACERDIIAGKVHIDSCPAVVTAGTSLYVKETEGGIIVSSPRDQGAIWFCQDQPALYERIPAGAHLIPLRADCRIQVGSYAMKSIHVYTAGIQLEWNEINISMRASDEWVERVHLAPLLDNKEVHLNRLDDLPDLGLQPTEWGSIALHHGTWLSGGALLVCAVLVVFLICKFASCSKRVGCGSCFNCFSKIKARKASYDVAGASHVCSQAKGDPMPVAIVVHNKEKESTCPMSFKTEILKPAYSDEALAEMHKNFEEIRKTGKMTSLAADSLSKPAKGKTTYKVKVANNDRPI